MIGVGRITAKALFAFSVILKRPERLPLEAGQKKSGEWRLAVTGVGRITAKALFAFSVILKRPERLPFGAPIEKYIPIERR